MDRRTIIAFAMMAGALLLYSSLFPSKQQAPPARPAPIVSETGTAPAVPRVGAASRAAATGAQGQPDGRVFGTARAGPDSQSRVFDLPDYRAVIDPVGGRITSWVLKRFTDAAEQPADIVPSAGPGLLEVDILTGGEDLDLSRTAFDVAPRAEGAPRGLTLTSRDTTGATVRLDYEFPGSGSYSTRLRVFVSGAAGDNRASFLRLAFPQGVAHLERDPKLDRLAAAGVALIGTRTVKHAFGGKQGFGFGSGGGDKGWSEDAEGVVHWAGVRSKYFLAAIMPRNAESGQPGVDAHVGIRRGAGENHIRTEVLLPLNLSGPTEYVVDLYAGPMDYAELARFKVGLEKARDLGWRWVVPVSKLLIKFFQMVHSVVPNYGLCIIILSILVKVVFYPLSRKSVESMRDMQRLKPEMERLNEKFKDDPQKKYQATLELYKKHKVNPLGGCLPIVVQMPVFIALYNVLSSAVELRKAPFGLWIGDLSAPDRVGAVAGLPIHIMPLIMAGTMVWQQKLTPTDPRQAAMAYIMPVVMTVFFYAMPSGLVLYWTVTNLMAIGQQIWINRSVVQPTVAA
jgi:YidC/Oxa1 family membrane protein insertase